MALCRLDADGVITTSNGRVRGDAQYQEVVSFGVNRCMICDGRGAEWILMGEAERTFSLGHLHMQANVLR